MAKVHNPKRPTQELIRLYAVKWTQDVKYTRPERAVDLLFSQFPLNTVFEQVLLKVSALNDLYRTNILDTYDVAARIIRVRDLDDRLKAGDLKAVSDVAKCKRRFYSFSTKYCSFHNPVAYPIYDKYVRAMLMTYKRQCNFAEFKSEEIEKDYSIFVHAIEGLRVAYGLQSVSLRDIDHFLWLHGKECFQFH